MITIQNIDDWVFPQLKFMRELIQDLQKENKLLKNELKQLEAVQSPNKNKIIQLKLSK